MLDNHSFITPYSSAAPTPRISERFFVAPAVALERLRQGVMINPQTTRRNFVHDNMYVLVSGAIGREPGFSHPLFQDSATLPVRFYDVRVVVSDNLACGF